MQELISLVASVVIEVLVIAFLTLLSMAVYKGHDYLEKAKQKDTLGIIDLITDRAVEYIAKEFKGESGEAKRQKALEFTIRTLSAYGIAVSEEQLLADIENGYNKWKNRNEYSVMESEFIDLEPSPLDSFSEE